MFSKRDVVLAWAERGALPRERIVEALRLVGTIPGRDGWRAFFSQLLLWGGVTLVTCGVIFFFASNWQNLGVYSKFALAELLLLISLVICLLRPADSPSFKAALFGTALLLGALFALFGQVYQTGADPWQLFATWAVTMLPLALLGRLPVLWLLWLVVVNVAVALYFQVRPRFLFFDAGNAFQFWMHFAVNTAALVLWEGLRSLGSGWMRVAWLPRLLALGCGVSITSLILIELFDRQAHGLYWALPTYGAWLLALHRFYRRRHDLFVLSGGALTLVVVCAGLLAKLLLNRGMAAGGLLLVGLAVLGLSALCGAWLKKVADEGAS